ncbi:shikimate kinase, partial [Dehalococcoidia bacterium]|nr:shikimate kinase [Dehalococcoidia bacterium]
MNSNIIIITGFSGTGKSRVGKAVAEILGWEFFDTDQEIVRQAGKPVAQIFEEEGEESFRTLERTIVQESCAGNGRVVATGGGAIIDPTNYQTMTNAGFMVCLEAST